MKDHNDDHEESEGFDIICRRKSDPFGDSFSSAITFDFGSYRDMLDESFQSMFEVGDESKKEKQLTRQLDNSDDVVTMTVDEVDYIQDDDELFTDDDTEDKLVSLNDLAVNEVDHAQDDDEFSYDDKDDESVSLNDLLADEAPRILAIQSTPLYSKQSLIEKVESLRDSFHSSLLSFDNSTMYEVASVETSMEDKRVLRKMNRTILLLSTILQWKALTMSGQ